MRVRGYAPATPCWSVFSSADPASATEFYTNLFGWTTATTDEGLTTFLLRGLAVAGLVETPGQPSAWLTYMSTDDLASVAGRVVDANGTVLQPPTEVGTRGHAALFADAGGGVFGVWQRGTFGGAQVIDEPSAVCWSEVTTRDVPATVDFYGKVFGWTERIGEAAAHQEYHEWISGNRVVGGISRMDENYPPGTPPHWRTIFEIADCADAIARTPELGGEVIAGPVDAGVGQAAFLRDPTGGTVLIIELDPELRAAFG